MKKNSAQQNIYSLLIVANQLQELVDAVTFVGGSVLGILITDQAAPDVRFTSDIDCIINHVITVSHYYQFTNKLRQKGFKELSMGDHPICRWDCKGIHVDIVPTERNILGFSNKWYPEAASNSIPTKINNTSTINVISAPYFLATKLEAFKDRGNQDFLFSHDLEDVISLLDGRPEIIEEVKSTNSSILKEFLSSELALLFENSRFQQALPGHLNYSNNIEQREEIILERITNIINA
jgi:hypothetical protein